jgi:hypothetical protein
VHIYRHTQSGTRLVWFLVTLAVVAAFSAFAHPEARWVYGSVIAILLGSGLVFASLTVEVTPTELLLAFGPGWVRRSYPVANIADARAVTNPWYYGWGIHITPHGWLYNVAGSDAVEVAFRNGRKVRVGTDEPSRLVTAIRQAIESHGA